jgi:hypothetical protein
MTMNTRKSEWNRFKVDGEDVAIQYQDRTSTADCGAKTFLWVGSKKIELGGRTLPPMLARLVPPAYATSACKPQQWATFVRMAKATGCL